METTGGTARHMPRVLLCSFSRSAGLGHYAPQRASRHASRNVRNSARFPLAGLSCQSTRGRPSRPTVTSRVPGREPAENAPRSTVSRAEQSTTLQAIRTALLRDVSKVAINGSPSGPRTRSGASEESRPVSVCGRRPWRSREYGNARNARFRFSRPGRRRPVGRPAGPPSRRRPSNRSGSAAMSLLDAIAANSGRPGVVRPSSGIRGHCS